MTSDDQAVDYRRTNKSASKSNQNNRTAQEPDGSAAPTSQTVLPSKPSIRHQTSNITKRSHASNIYQGSRISNSTQRSNLHAVYGVSTTVGSGLFHPTDKTPFSSLNKKSIDTQSNRKQLVREQQHLVRQSTTTAARSLSKGKKERDQSGSLNRMYNQLEPRAKLALNQAFLNNIKCGRNHQNFQQAMHQYANQVKERKRAKRAIE